MQCNETGSVEAGIRNKSLSKSAALLECTLSAHNLFCSIYYVSSSASVCCNARIGQGKHYALGYEKTPVPFPSCEPRYDWPRSETE